MHLTQLDVFHKVKNKCYKCHTFKFDLLSIFKRFGLFA